MTTILAHRDFRSAALAALLACGLAAGIDAAQPASDDGGYAQPSAEEVAEIRAFFEEVLAAKAACGEKCSEMCSGECTVEKKGMDGYARDASKMKAGERTATYMVTLLSKKPEAWSVVKPLVVERFLDEATSSDHRAVILNVLAYDGSETAKTVSSELFDKAPQSFSENQVIRFAESGNGDFVKSVKALTVKYNASKNPASIRPAAFMAFEGVDVGKRTLGRVVKSGNKVALGPETVTEFVVASAALDCLEEGKGHFAKAQRKVHADVLTALDKGDLERARELAIRAEFFSMAAEEGAKTLSFLDDRLRWFCMERREKLATADEVFKLIEAVTPM